MQTALNHFPDDTRHYLAYVPWRTILNWRREEIKAGRLYKGSQLKPFAYANRLKHAFEYLRKGDVIWIFTIPYYGHYGSFPALNAMLVVEDKVDRGVGQNKSQLRKIPDYFNVEGEQKLWRYVFIGNQEFSRYFPINNFLEQIRPWLSEKATRRLESNTEKGFGFLGMIFQKAKAISPEQGRQFFEFQQNLRKQKTLFISYRHREEPEVVDKLVKSLLKAHLNCWLDLNRIPRGLSKGAVDNPKAFLKKELLAAVEECDGSLALESEAYWQSFWTGLEYGASIALSTQKPGFQFFETNLSLLKTEEERQKLINKISQFAKFPIISEI